MDVKSKSEIKQVIVIRKDIMQNEQGKMAVQVAHASLQVFFDKRYIRYCGTSDQLQITIDVNKDMVEWLDGIYTKICVYAKSEEELLKIYEKAKNAKLPCALVTDVGLTVFEKPTVTCCAIGPAKSEEIDKITKRLRLVK